MSNKRRNLQHQYLGIALIKNFFFFFFFDNAKIRVKFVGSYLKQDENIVTVYEINLWPFKYSSDFMLKSCLFGAVKLTKNSDPDKYKYSGYGNGFDMNRKFSPASSKEFFDIQAIIEYGFTLKRVRDMIRTYSQMHRTDN